MVAAEICKQAILKCDAIYSIQGQGMGRYFHHHMAYARVQHLFQYGIKLQDVRSSVFGSIIFTQYLVAQSSYPCRFDLFLQEHLIQH